MRRTVLPFVMLAALMLSGAATGCDGERDTQEAAMMNTEQTVPEIDTIPHEKIETATFAMG